MSIDLKIQTGILSQQDYLNSFSSGLYQNSQPSVDLSNDKDKKKWRHILKLSEKEFEEAIIKFGTKIRDLRLGLRNLKESE